MFYSVCDFGLNIFGLNICAQESSALQAFPTHREWESLLVVVSCGRAGRAGRAGEICFLPFSSLAAPCAPCRAPSAARALPSQARAGRDRRLVRWWRGGQDHPQNFFGAPLLAGVFRMDLALAILYICVSVHHRGSSVYAQAQVLGKGLSHDF